ncbi:MAG: hypothetical protein RLZZ336_2174 [Cyanobacteriota bacterium]|jgi:hypothetical protein
MHRSASVRSGLLIAVTVLLLGTVATASAAGTATGNEQPDATTASPLPPSNPEQLALSRHLKAIGALFFGAWWCPACSRQKALFGEQGAEQLPYIECDKVPADRERCQAAAIQAFPTWELKGKERLVGVQSIEELKTWSGYTP